MARWRIALALLAATAVAGCMWLLLGSDAARRTSDRGTSGVGAPAGETARRPSETPAAATPGRKRPTLEERMAAADRIGMNAVLSGSVVVLAEDGTEHAAEDGSFRLEGAGRTTTVEVTQGKWRARVVPTAGYHVSDIRLRRRLAFPHDGELSAPGGAIRASWMRPSVMRVVDAVSGADLSGVFVGRRSSWKRNNWLRPTPDEKFETVAENATSPIRLPDAEDITSYWVRAPSYAWQDVRVRHRIGGEFRASLVRAGALEVRFENHHPGSEALFRLYRAAGNVAAERAIPATGPLVLGDIAARDYEARVEIGPSGWDIPVLAQAEVEVPAGGRATLTLTLTDPPANKVPFAGTLVIHEGWGAVGSKVYVQPIGRRRAARIKVEQGPDGAWDAGRVEPGRYLVKVSAFFWQRIFEVGAAGLTDARIEVPAPADVAVTVIDDRGIAVDAEGLSWFPVRPRGSRGGGLGAAEPTGRPGEYRFRAPAGKIMLDVDSDHHEVVEARFRVRPGKNEVTLRTTRLCAVVMTFLHNGAPVAVASDIHVKVEGIGHEGRARLWSSHDIEKTIGLTGPGRYRVVVTRPPPGYRKPPDRTITLETGRVLRIDIPLEREQ